VKVEPKNKCKQTHTGTGAQCEKAKQLGRSRCEGHCRGVYRCEQDALKEGGDKMKKDFQDLENSENGEDLAKYNRLVHEATEKNNLMDPKHKSRKACLVEIGPLGGRGGPGLLGGLFSIS
jgi:hypothetical protein